MILSAKKKNVMFCGLSGLLLAATGFLHLWKIGPVPSGLYGDECSIAYNAYSIAETGADEYGRRYPVFFRGFDNYHDPVMVYCLVPLVKIFGLNERVARFPSAGFQLLAAVMFAFLAQEYCRNRWIAVASGFLFSVMPWAFPVSRTISAGYTPMLLGMTAGWLCLIRAFGRRSYGYAVAAGVAWAFAMYAHNIGRPMTALLLVCFVLGYHRSLLRRWKIVATFCVSLIAAMMPMIVWVLRTPQALTTRFETLSIFQDHPPPRVLLERFGSRFAEYFSPQFLWLRGDSNVRHNIGFGGELFWFFAPLVIFGLFVVVRYFLRNPPYRFLLLGTLVYPTAASLTEDHMHSMRCVNGVIFWTLLGALGARWLWQKKAVGRKLLLLIIALGCVEITLYLQTYFSRKYQSYCRSFFQGELADALKYCFQQLQPGEVLYISDSVFSFHGAIVDEKLKPFLYAYVLFYGKIDPREYQRTGFPTKTVRLYDRRLHHAGLLLRCNYYFLPQNDPHWAINGEYVPPGSVLLETVRYERSDAEFEIFRLPT